MKIRLNYKDSIICLLGSILEIKENVIINYLKYFKGGLMLCKFTIIVLKVMLLKLES